ncbi:hypothetical protein B7O32_001825 [Enterobacter hormaechei]|jgi:hypothetical protein|nr:MULTISPECIES: hypothetical protein [Gammaproteobacteria]EHF4995455.1 hypothetical protein [Enterobacter hormaechei]HCA9868909.1 hypothetical protein [Klebsiella pneumoniae]MBK3806929.1 hypothetical protein [Stutzerimonas stutzeri]MDH0184397.1 hypothetical protein [Stutzerimonas stutzeri]MDH1543094.1 hypothetical protein [Stutzerimonas stutzeri]
MAIPTHCGMPPLHQNIEGLRSHAMLISIFMPEPDVSVEKRKWRSWLVHCLVKTARHYNDARSLILAQISEGQRSSAEMAKGRLLPVFDFAFAMEDCITSLEKAVACIRALSDKGEMPSAFVLALYNERQSLNDFRRQQEHMHSQIAAGQTGDGPILVTLSDDGDGMRLRGLTMSFVALFKLIDAIYRDIATFFPAHDIQSPPSPGGVPQISMSMTIEVVQGEPKPPDVPS